MTFVAQDPSGEIFPRDGLPGEPVLLLLDVVVGAFLEGLDILAPYLLGHGRVIEINALHLFLVHIKLRQEAVLDLPFIPGGEDQRLIHLTKRGKIPAFIDLLLQHGDHDIAQDLLGQLGAVDVESAGTIVINLLAGGTKTDMDANAGNSIEFSLLLQNGNS